MENSKNKINYSEIIKEGWKMRIEDVERTITDVKKFTKLVTLASLITVKKGINFLIDKIKD